MDLTQALNIASGKPSIPEMSPYHRFKLEQLLKEGVPMDAAAEIMLAPDQKSAESRYSTIRRK